MQTFTRTVLWPALRSRDTLAFACATAMVLAVKAGLLVQVPW